MQAHQNTIEVEIVSKVRSGGRVTAFELEAVGGGELPAWTPGSHIELRWTTDGQEFVRTCLRSSEA